MKLGWSHSTPSKMAPFEGLHMTFLFNGTPLSRNSENSYHKSAFCIMIRFADHFFGILHSSFFP